MSPLVLFFHYGVLAIIFGNGFGDEHEYRLTKYLLDGYDAGVRPAENSSQPLAVVFGLSLHHIIDVDEKNQILTTNCWVTQIWTDHHLKWNASEFAGIRVIRVPYNRVWRPDTILYNNADPQYSSAVINTNVIVSHTGEVVWLSHGIFRSSCDIDVEFFPFDEQRCVLKWASWTYDGYQLELEKQSEQGDVSNYQANGEFDLVNFSARRNVEYYSCCPEPYPDITYEIRLRRRPMFYVFNLILPCILINSVALLVFYVPSESGEKVTLGISALLSMTVFLMTIRESLPPTEKTPLINICGTMIGSINANNSGGMLIENSQMSLWKSSDTDARWNRVYSIVETSYSIAFIAKLSNWELAGQLIYTGTVESLYYGVSICLVTFASALAVVTLNLHHRGIRGSRVPGIVRSLVLDKLARIVLLNFQEERRSEPVEPPRRKNNCPLHCKPELGQSQSSPKFVTRREESNSSSPSLDKLLEE
ncbi:Neuronal acetylcholine receptor subunit alpha-7 [Apis cerana cerana]|uniref:Neuronal acetylcholine receptor subunit alpha-7 n=1 Tax=Apis cerana cerana TaxID=94128 RepID=A0A2A3ETR5_APICC|nr:Neuronal acetylcholine receptor subunit alpha-7 [Apis cerana cerana]